MSIPKTLRHLADAIEALISAYEATSDGFTSDYITSAERECYKALSQLVSSKHMFGAGVAPRDTEDESGSQVLANLSGHISSEIETQSDDAVVDLFASAMKLKLETLGIAGWRHTATAKLMSRLREQIENGDMRGVANLAMMIWHNERVISGLIGGE